MDLHGITREQKQLAAAVSMLLFIISLFLKWQTFGPISGSGADLGSWPLVLLIALAAGGSWPRMRWAWTCPCAG